MLALDTSVIIEWARGNESVRQAILHEQEAITITVFTIHELLAGKVRMMPELVSVIPMQGFEPRDAMESAQIEKELMLKGRAINKVDIFIAGICRSRGFHLMTFDRDFLNVKNLEVKLLSQK